GGNPGRAPAWAWRSRWLARAARSGRKGRPMTYEPRPRAPAQPARIVIVDDHELARAGLRSMLAQERDLTVVGEATDGAQALALCRRLSPDLVLMDVRMPGLDGLAATAALKQESPAP